MEPGVILQWLAGGRVPHRRRRRPKQRRMLSIEVHHSSDDEHFRPSPPRRLETSRGSVTPQAKPQQVETIKLAVPATKAETTEKEADTTKLAEPAKEPVAAKEKKLRFEGYEKPVPKPASKSALKKKSASQGKDVECHCWCDVCMGCKWSDKPVSVDEGVARNNHHKDRHCTASASAGKLEEARTL